jgi:hypothetical protein
MGYSGLDGVDSGLSADQPPVVDRKWRKLGIYAAVASVSLLAAAWYIWDDQKKEKKLRERIYRLD